jgi:hypothetical protein
VSEQELHTCKSCGHSFTGVYCNRCGEKVILPQDRSMKSFLSNILIALTFADNKFVKSLWFIISKPGFLSKEYAEGRRVNYIRPLQLFFILNLIYFLFPILQLFSSSLRTQMYYLFHSAFARELVVNRLTQEGMSLAAFELMYNDKTTGLAKLLVIIFVFLAALPLSLIFRKKNRYFTDHATLAVELVSFNIFINAIVLSVLLWVASRLFRWGELNWNEYLNDGSLTVVFVLTNLYFLYRAARNFYAQQGKRLILKSLAGILGLFLALEAYRFILFLITFWSV